MILTTCRFQRASKRLKFIKKKLIPITNYRSWCMEMGSDNQLEQNETMPKVDLKRDIRKLKSTEIVYMKRMEQQNLERAQRVQRYRKANNRTALALSLGVIGIYVYTIHSVKQEKFLDDFIEPEKVVEKLAESN